MKQKTLKKLVQVVVFIITFMVIVLGWQLTHILYVGESVETTEQILKDYNVESLQELNMLYPNND